MVSPRKKRKAVGMLADCFDVSERRACKLLSQPRATQRYLPIERDDEKPLVRRIIELASMFGRYGYRMITGCFALKAGGWRPTGRSQACGTYLATGGLESA